MTPSSSPDAPPGLPFGLFDWIEANASSFEPPVSNKVVWQSDDLIFMIVRGPNSRDDFHIDPYDEVFMQLRGSIRIDLMIDDQRETHWVNEGQVMLVPANVAHSPRRLADSWGLVIERPRGPDMLDALVWYCEECNEFMSRVDFHLTDIEVELAAALDAHNADPLKRTCPNGHLNPVPDLFSQSPPPTTPLDRSL